MSDDSTTRNLADILAKISNTDEMERFFDNPKITDSFDNFTAYFRSLIEAKELTDSELIAKSGIEKSYYYQIMKGSKNPGRDKVLRMCIAAGFTIRETTRALELSGNAVLYPKNRRDIIISVGINQKASVDDINLLLDKYKEDCLT
ncbi:MAG: hypothetical protein K6C35_04245 [Eubacterium sp.]|nr:hypothetical protein [Eubacterium sp.]